MTEREITKLASDLYDEGLRAADREKIAEKTDLSQIFWLIISSWRVWSTERAISLWDSHGNMAVPFLTCRRSSSYTIRLHLLPKKSKVLFRMPC